MRCFGGPPHLFRTRLRLTLCVAGYGRIHQRRVSELRAFIAKSTMRVARLDVWR